MNREIKKEVLKLYKKKDFKGIDKILKQKDFSLYEGYSETIYKSLCNKPYLKGYSNLIKKQFMGLLENF
jgi:hypothetical protein